jgi:hypothetical protein
MTRFGVRTTFSPDPARRESAITDIAALSTRGVAGVRMRIGWDALFPTEGRVDGRAVDDLIEFTGRVAATGMELWPTLCGNRLPGWFLNEGAFADPKAADRFWSQYVDTLASAIADAATGWIPFETPIALLHEGWRTGLRDPGIADEAKFADAFGGVLTALAAVARLLNGASLQLSIDALHVGATNDVVEVFREAVLRGRLALPGRIVREIAGLQGAYRSVGLTFPDQAPLASGDALRRWRDQVVGLVYATSERFSPLAVSIASIPDTATDAEHADLFDTVQTLLAEVRDGGAELQWVWLGDTSLVTGLIGKDPSTSVPRS